MFPRLGKKDSQRNAKGTTNAEIGTKALSPAKTIPTPSHKLVENLSSTKSSKVDAQKVLDLFLGEELSVHREPLTFSCLKILDYSFCSFNKCYQT